MTSALWLLVFNETLKVFTWNLLSRLTCPGATLWCERNCYAHKGNFTFPSVRAAHRRNTILSRLPSFVDRMTEEVRGRDLEVLRVHSSGDLYSPEYAEKWLRIAKRCKTTHFLAYTRTWSLPEFYPVLRRLSRLDNFTVRASIDPTSPIDRLPKFLDRNKAYIYGSPGAGEGSNCLKQVEKGLGCPECMRCWIGAEDITFLKH
jgi:hypothetical protein